MDIHSQAQELFWGVKAGEEGEEKNYKMLRKKSSHKMVKPLRKTAWQLLIK